MEVKFDRQARGAGSTFAGDRDAKTKNQKNTAVCLVDESSARMVGSRRYTEVTWTAVCGSAVVVERQDAGG